MSKIYIYNTVAEQENAVKNFDFENSGHENILFGNRENNDVSFTGDLWNNQKFVIDGNNLDKYINYNPRHYIELNVFPNDFNDVSIYNKATNTPIRHINNIQTMTNDEPIYKVGLVSDVHYNDSDTSDTDPDTYNDDNAEYSEDLKNAFKVFAEENVDFVSCSGDISTDNVEHLRNFKRCFDKYMNNASFYTCVGNHDTVLRTRQRQDWLNVDNLNDKYGIIRFNDIDGTSFYFIRPCGTKQDVYIYLNLEYGWASYDNYDTHNTRLLKTNELLTKTADELSNDDKHLYNKDTLEFFANLLEEHKNDRCFIFTHLMFRDKAGTYHSNDYYNYYADHQDVLRGDQGDFLYDLLNRYDNNYWFCGHSHYKWNWQELDRDINVTKANNSYNIHLPSLSRPLPLGIKSYKNAPRDSEGAVMDVYEDHIVIRGYVFKEGDDISTDKLVAYDGEMKYMDASHFHTTNVNIQITQLENNIIEFVIPGVSTDIKYTFDSEESNITNYKIQMPVLRFSDVEIKDENGTDITEEAKAEHFMGFRDHTSSDDYFYYFEDNHIYTLDKDGLIFKLSSQSKWKGNHTITIKMKVKYAFINTKYQNLQNPIAFYQL